MPVIDNNKQLSSTEEREILDIMTSPDEQAKIDLLKLRVLIERNNDVEKGVLNAFHNDPLLKSKAEQVKQLLFQSAVRGNGALREYKRRVGTSTATTTDIECISILQAGSITCESIQCSDEQELLIGQRGERTATHLTRHAVDSSLGPNTFNKMMSQLKIAGYEGEKINNIAEMLHILLDFMIQTIKPFAQGKEVIPPGTKLKPISPKNSTQPKPGSGNQPKPGNGKNPSQPQSKPKAPNNPSSPSPTPIKPKTGAGSAPSQPEASTPTPTQPKAPIKPNNPTTNPNTPAPTPKTPQPTPPNQPKQGKDTKNTPKTNPGSSPSQPTAPSQPETPTPKTPSKPNSGQSQPEVPKPTTKNPNQPKPGNGKNPSQPETPKPITKTPDQSTEQCDQFGNTIKQITTIDELPSSRTDDIVYYLTIGTTQYILYNNQRVADTDQKKMMNRSKDPKGVLTVDGVIMNPAPSTPETIPDNIGPMTRPFKRIQMIYAGRLEPRALKYAGVEIDSSISYTELAETVNSIHDAPLRKEMVRRSLSNTTDNDGKVIPKALAMQKLFGMREKPSEGKFYMSDTIQPSLNKISLTRFERPNRVRWDKEQIEKSNIPNDVKATHERFRSGNLPTNNLNYCVVSKTDGYIYLFTADHRLVASQPVLLGKTKGDKVRGKNPNINTTPPGQYQITGRRAFEAPEYGDPGYFSILTPMEGQYHIRSNADGSHNTSKQKMDLRIHPTVKPNIREPLLQPGVALDQRRFSNGCVNISRATYDEFLDHIDYTKKTNMGSTVYITPEATSPTVVT